MVIVPRAVIKPIRRKLRFLYWLHEFAHAAMCVILKVEYEIEYEDGIPVAVNSVETCPNIQFPLICVFPILLLFPFYAWDFTRSIRAELITA